MDTDDNKEFDMDWQEQLDTAWGEVEVMAPDAFVQRIEDIVSGPDVPPERRIFEMACAHDSTGRSDLAVPLYSEALDQGISGYERRRTVLQLASSLRNLGRSDESVELLSRESTQTGDGLDAAVVVFRALALVETGAERDAVAELIHALADYLPRYNASAHRYADLLTPIETKEEPG